MTVKELIEALETIKDKTQVVYVFSDDAAVECKQLETWKQDRSSNKEILVLSN